MNSSGLEEIRQMIESCRNRDNVGCKALIDYRENANVAGASHPVTLSDCKWGKNHDNRSSSGFA